MTIETKNEAPPYVVWDRLEIGPVIIESKRLKMPYRIIQGDKEDQIELIYTYEEKVFDRHDPVCMNLASIIGAQLALNYGLFCHRMIFHGRFDETDRRFLTAMADNTATEIYVKKFLEHNPFLIGEAAHIQAQIKESYLNATLEFPDEINSSDPDSIPQWEMDAARHCILSSGGKDSLLSYSLINEMGLETHPLYVNESGRHWFTALNAYRHFKDHIPNTGRVWTNCDRVFVWMLKHLPFVRQDFARFRADEYPIRLWTVAVFLFGVIPLMRKRRIQRLIIGDEYDTTRVCNHQGITHYDGLFDQSLYFDEALTHYYEDKKWNIRQFSILRPLSEILIQKILSVRYPHIQEHQVSCHAAHREGGRIYPCGVCEKCRRIIVMLKVFGIEPSQCGYKESQVPFAVEGLVKRGINQESAGVNHILYMLSQKKLLSASLLEGRTLEPHPEVMRLRFDPGISPADSIPEDLQQKLYSILQQHTENEY